MAAPDIDWGHLISTRRLAERVAAERRRLDHLPDPEAAWQQVQDFYRETPYDLATCVTVILNDHRSRTLPDTTVVPDFADDLAEVLRNLGCPDPRTAAEAVLTALTAELGLSGWTLPPVSVHDEFVRVKAQADDLRNRFQPYGLLDPWADENLSLAQEYFTLRERAIALDALLNDYGEPLPRDATLWQAEGTRYLYAASPAFHKAVEDHR